MEEGTYLEITTKSGTHSGYVYTYPAAPDEYIHLLDKRSLNIYSTPDIEVIVNIKDIISHKVLK